MQGGGKKGWGRRRGSWAIAAKRLILPPVSIYREDRRARGGSEIRASRKEKKRERKMACEEKKGFKTPLIRGVGEKGGGREQKGGFLRKNEAMRVAGDTLKGKGSRGPHNKFVCLRPGGKLDRRIGRRKGQEKQEKEGRRRYVKSSVRRQIVSSEAHLFSGGEEEKYRRRRG